MYSSYDFLNSSQHLFNYFNFKIKVIKRAIINSNHILIIQFYL
jgi:hypothetical protein